MATAQEEETQTAKATITEPDCLKCHETIVMTLGRRGKAHQTLCLDCHVGHPPADIDIMPKCSRCHNGAAHFDEITGCINCHKNPHTPKDISYTKDVTAPCVTCHDSQNEQLQTYPSIHTKFNCGACHWFHGQIQPCQNCHKPHTDTMIGMESCRICHKAHMPLAIVYGAETPSEDCGSCHTDVYDQLVTNLTKHRSVPCANCHKEKHKMIPQCQECHGLPHADQIHGEWDQCGECHGIAHDLSPTAKINHNFREPRD